MEIGLADHRAGASPTGGRRAAAILVLLLVPAVLILSAAIVVQQFPRGLIVLCCVAVALAAAWYGLLRQGAARLLGAALAATAVAVAAVVLISDGDHLLEAVLIVAGLAAATGLAKAAFMTRAPLRAVSPPTHPVLFHNPKSGGGKAERFALAPEARSRGITPIELTPGTDLERLVRDAVADGADGLAMAGGDGSQAVVAAIAAELDLPYACVPAGTRNHFALDLGVDRDDVVGALDAFVDGGERR
ncbi:MAG TPA: acylglycerol kinase family protein, partial [Gemmatimonadales bacterium]|nr:acylglycerol kinase family protein [Gemmatimonadales bacterium]